MVDNDTQMGYHFSMREHIASMNIINVNKIVESIEKANNVLDRAKEYGNQDAIMTWTRILYQLKLQWQDALVEIQTKGHYSFQ
jgi:glucose-6-phosphate dehydrogenase assembly protein OpcA